MCICGSECYSTIYSVSFSSSYQLPKGVNTIHVEIFDERTLTDDELVAWVSLPIPEVIFQASIMQNFESVSRYCTNFSVSDSLCVFSVTVWDCV